MSQKQVKKIYNLQGYILDKTKIKKHEKSTHILLFCHLQRKSMFYQSQRSYSVCAKHTRKIKHQVFEGRLVWIVIEQRRFYFSKYDKRLWEPLPNVNTKKQTSNTYRKNTIQDLQNASYTHSASIRKSSAMFAPRLIDELPTIKMFWPEGTSKVSLDGKSTRKYEQMFTLVDPTKKQLLSAIPPMGQTELIGTLKTEISIEQRECVVEACIDMDKFMKAVIEKTFPNARIVIDRFHVIQHAIRCLDKYRRRFQQMHKVNLSNLKTLLAKPRNKLKYLEKEELDFFLKEYPIMRKGYIIIQELRKMYLQKNRELAEIQLEKVIKLCYGSDIDDMMDLAETLERWFGKILNFHLSHITNGFVEGLHNRFEVIKRNHFGIQNTERFVKRLMYTFIPAFLYADLLSKVVG